MLRLKDRRIRANTWLVPLAVPLLGGIWLVATRVLHRTVLDLFCIGGFLGFEFLALPLFAVTCVWSFVCIEWQLSNGDGSSDPGGQTSRVRLGRAVLPLVTCAVALALYLFGPFGRPLGLLDFRVHYVTRAEIVRRVEAGELRPPNSWGYRSLGASSPPKFSWPDRTNPAPIRIPLELPLSVSDEG